MNCLLDYDTQDIFISLERVDVDYLRASPEVSEKIIRLFKNNLKLLSPKTLGVLVQDIEAANDRYVRMAKEHPSMQQWRELEKEAVSLLQKEYETVCILKGIHTEFSNPSELIYEYDKVMELSEKNFSKILKYAFIYALPRFSYMVDTTINYILKHKQYLIEEDKKFMLKEIEELVKKRTNNYDDKSVSFINKSFLGTWLYFAERLKQ